MKTLKILALAFPAFLLVACNDASPPATAQTIESSAPESAQTQPAVAPTSQTPQWDESLAPVAGTRLTATPSALDLCSSSNGSAEVSWDASALTPTSLELWARRNDRYTLWAAVKSSSGTKTTGQWLREGSEIILVNPATKSVINRIRFTAAPCP